VISLATTVLNPFGMSVWTYVYDLSTNPVIRTTISEWEPTTLDSLPGWITILSALGVAGLLIMRRQSVPWTKLMTLGGFFLLALTAQRAIVWWGLVAPVVLAGVLAQGSTREFSQTATPRGSKRPAHVVIATLLAAVVLVAPWFRGSRPGTFLSQVPLGVTEAVRTLPPGSRLLVHQPWGSWFEFAVPDDPVFVDSRIEIIPVDVWKEYGEVAFAGAGWHDVLDNVDVDAIVAAGNWELLDKLREDTAEWRVIYEDADGVVFVRATAVGT
jgi:hypothetical protein